LVIRENPNGISEDFHFLCHALVNLDNVAPDLIENATALVQNFKEIAGTHWNSFFLAFPPPLQSAMREKFGV
jgi:hypothetical protein